MTLLQNLNKTVRRQPGCSGRALAFLLAGLLATAGAMAEKPEWADGGKKYKEGKHAQKEKREKKDKDGDHRGRADRDDHDDHKERGERREDVRVGGYFREEQRIVVRTYYTEQYRAGRCPPGLAKKHNGCMPPGQARKWVVGQPLPRQVVYYSVPAPIIVQLGAPPTGHRYVRVATDILLIAIGTGMVIDAMEDLGRM